MIPSAEQKKILQMVQDGSISAAEAMKLIKALEESSTEIEVVEADAAPQAKKLEAIEFDEIARKAQRLWRIPLWIGVSITVLCSYWLHALIVSSNYGFWFYCTTVLFLLGVLLIAVFSGSRNLHWVYLRVDQWNDEWPGNIVLGFPLPLGVASWILNNFGNNIGGLSRDAVTKIIQVLSHGLSSKDPLIVNVNDDEDGERVQVYIG